MTWNHRVVRRRIWSLGEQIDWFGIHECFYDKKDESDPGWTDEPVTVEGESIDVLRETLERMLLCLDKPIIEDTEPQVE